jgi:hypothetical protein
MMLVYDTLIKTSESYVNLNILYFVSMFGIISIFIVNEMLKSRGDMKVFYGAMLVYPLSRVVLNLICINKTWNEYQSIVSNHNLDNLTWIIVIFIIVLMIWQRR